MLKIPWADVGLEPSVQKVLYGLDLGLQEN